MIRLCLDFESYSEADLPAVGAWKYAEHPSTELLSAAIAVGDAEPVLWLPGDPFPYELECADEVHAWNAEFEVAMWLRCCVRRYGWPVPPLDLFRCTMSRALSFGLPGKLEQSAAAMRVTEQKDAGGHRVMLKLSKPRSRVSKANPDARWTPQTAQEDFARLYSYNLQDVRAERAVGRALPRQALPEIEQQTYLETLWSNARGMAIDRAGVAASIAGMETHCERLEAEFIDLTGGLKSTQLAPVRTWFQETQKVYLPDMTKDTLAKALDFPALTPAARRAIEIRQSLGQVSTKKMHAMARSVCADGRVRGMLQYHGAQTGRWAGRLIQLQNLAKPTRDLDGIKVEDWVDRPGAYDPEILSAFGDPMAFYSAYVRPMLIASPGKTLLVADFNAIEARVLAWLAGEEWLLEAFRAGRDPYLEMATIIYARLIEGKGPERDMGKRVILGAGYQMGAERFVQQCADYGVSITTEFGEQVISAYREKNRAIVALWAAMNKAAMTAVDNFGVASPCGRVTFMASPRWLQMRLPSGRCISYAQPHIGRGKFGPCLKYWGVDTYTRQWSLQDTYGGAFTEQATQAAARDLCRDAMLRIVDHGYDVLFSSHDEIVAEKEALHANVDSYCQLMAEVPEWAQGCPIAAEGWSGTRYRK